MEKQVLCAHAQLRLQELASVSLGKHRLALRTKLRLQGQWCVAEVPSFKASWELREVSLTRPRSEPQVSEGCKLTKSQCEGRKGLARDQGGMAGAHGDMVSED